MTFARGTYGTDSAATVDYETAAHTGSRFHSRYSAGDGNNFSSTQFKLCRLGEIDQIVGAGLDVMANFELDEDTPTKGAAEGAACGAADLQFWQSRGLNQGASIYISWEPGKDPDQFGAVEEFIRAYNDALEGFYLADALYAGIPALLHFGRMGLIKHGWIPESADASGIPEDHYWIFWPTKDQVAPAMSYLDDLTADSGLESIIWQTGNKWFPKRNADEDLVLLGGPIGSHLEAVGQAPGAGAGRLAASMSTIVLGEGGPHFQEPWPGPMLGFGPHDFFGNINGPAASHGGGFATEQPYVRMLQDRLLWLGMVPNRTYPSGWADGIFDIQGQGLGGPTTDAVTRFQAKYRPGPLTTLPGEVWRDDWQTLFSVRP